MKSVTKAIVTVVAAGMLAACGGGSGDSAGNGSTPSAEKSPKPAVRAPKEFDTSKGWQQTVSWPDDDKTELPVGAAPEAGVVAFLQKKGEKYVVEAREAATGALRWSSQPWQPPAPGKNVATDSSHLPQLLVVNQDDREYIAVWAWAPSFTEDDTFSLLLYPADSSGKEISPARTFSIPMPSHDRPRVVDGGKGILVLWEDSRPNDDRTTAIDLSKGRVTTYEELKLRCDEDGPWEFCSGPVEALSPDGPVVQLGAFGGFGVPGAWHAGDAVPPGSKTHPNKYSVGRIMEVLGGHILSAWFPENGYGNQSVTAVHDLKSGKLVASTLCASDSDGESRKPTLSPDGRYAVSDSVAFDLEQGKAYCFYEGGDADYVRLTSIADGTAYGYSRASGESGRPVTATLATGQVKALPQGTEIPSLLLADVGGFSLKLAESKGQGRQFVFHPRR
ncbi:hypothetical protein ACFYXM_07135 [Streptomyces sp. NPDC002476]|uniref:hypothetical protein n=1 Tax=Streptomyces sp. NPDC002476 TaxID=3364648 RepID=UPI0036C44520